MADFREIGEVFETHRDALFEWVISDFLDLPKEFNVCFRSPYIPLMDTSWYMTIYPNGMRRHGTEGWIGLFLHRGDSGSPVTVHYQLGVKRAGGGEEIIFGQCVCLQIGDAGSGGAWYLCRATMNNRLPDLVPSNRLTVTCRLRCEAHHSLQGAGYCPVPPKLKIQASPSEKTTAAEKTSLHNEGGRLLSSATQTEISNITIGGENSRRGKDSTSFDTKGGTFLSSGTQAEVSDITNGEGNSLRGKGGGRLISSATQAGRRLISNATQTGGRLLSSATQTGGRLLSSATQTEISDIILGEEKSRREEDETSFDSKGGRFLSSATQTEISELTVGEGNSHREDSASCDTKGFVDEAVQTDGHVDGNPERTEEMEKIRLKFKLWLQQPDEGDCIRRLRREHFEAKS